MPNTYPRPSEEDLKKKKKAQESVGGTLGGQAVFPMELCFQWPRR